MTRTSVYFLTAVVLVLVHCSYGVKMEDILTRDSLTGGFFGLNEQLEPSGIEVGFGLTQVFQRNVSGGLAANRRQGEYTGSYDLEILADLEQLFGIPGTLFLHGEGGWDNGIDEGSVGSYMGVNADAIGAWGMYIAELFYELSLTEQLSLTVGKIDFAGFFDTSAYANDEVTQFLNGALVNNPTIPFPEYCMGLILSYEINDRWYVMGGIGDADAEGTKCGFNTTFNSPHHFYYTVESGYNTLLDSGNGNLEGTYRFGMWYDSRPKAYTGAGQEKTDDMGFYASLDQMVTKENDNPEDTQGLGAFFRYGYAPDDKNDMEHFVSFGMQYQGLIDGRDDDILGVGYAHGVFSNHANAAYTANAESLIEVYYSTAITPWFTLSPSMQYISRPGGQDDIDDAVVWGVRAQITF